jgi:hypothetical protein
VQNSIRDKVIVALQDVYRWWTNDTDEPDPDPVKDRLLAAARFLVGVALVIAILGVLFGVFAVTCRTGLTLCP